MPSIAVLNTTNVDQFQNAICLRGKRFTITGQSAFAASVVSINLQRLKMLRVQESSPRVWHIAPDPSQIAILFQTEPGPPIGWRGAQVTSRQLIPLRPGVCGWHRLSAATAWGMISLRAEYLTAISMARIGRDLTPSFDDVAMTPPLADLTLLRRLHAEARRLFGTTPQTRQPSPETSALEQDLVEATLACLQRTRVLQDRKPYSHHVEIVQRFLALAEGAADRAVFLPEVCAEIGTSERTLRICFQQHLGLSPKRYLLLRRLHLAQRALAAADLKSQSVTEVATQYGFWELGRFSVYYKKVFGESPSSTLRREFAQRPQELRSPKSRSLERLATSSTRYPLAVAEIA